MNAGIALLDDGTPCLVYDEALPPVKNIEFSRADFLVTLVFDTVGPRALKKRKLEYPLSSDFVQVLEERKKIAIGSMKDGKLVNIKLIPVVFTKA